MKKVQIKEFEVIYDADGKPIYAAGKFPDGTYGIHADEDGLCPHFSVVKYCEICKALTIADLQA